MNLNDITTQLLFTTVPIWVEKIDGATMSGTGFIYNFPVADKPGQFIPLLITNQHVIAESKQGFIEIIEREGDLPSKTQRVRVQIPGSAQIPWQDSLLDLAAIPIGPVLNDLEKANKPAFFRSIGPELVPPANVQDELNALEEIVFIGYPSGLRDSKSAMPLIRRGITATPVWNDYEGTPTFLIDAGVFPGSSGSPVFILNQGAYATREGLSVGNRLLFLGVISQTILRPGDAKNAQVFLGLGKVIKSSSVKSFVERFVGTLKVT
jgi:hypothetical protein